MKAKEQIKGFARVPNLLVFDNRLSFKARMVMTVILSRPPGWKIYLNELLKHSDKEGKMALQTALKELVEFEYLNLVWVRDEENNRLAGQRYVTGKAIRSGTGRQKSRRRENLVIGKPVRLIIQKEVRKKR